MLIPPGETIIETKSCKLCGAVFHITDKDLEFYDKVSPVFKGKKESIPTPTFCPDCRQQRRCVFLNQRNLYVRPCDATGKTIVSQYQPSARHPVYDVDYWHSDAWDPLGYGRSFDFSSSFFGQFEELFFSVPRPSRWVTFNENCDYMNGGAYNRDCYLIFNGSHNERCYYSLGIARCSHCMDSTRISSSEGLYECVEASGCFRCFFCRAIQNSSDCWYSLACGSCRHCFGCVNLVNAQYAIFNETHSPEEYHRRVDALLALDPLQLRKMIADHFGKYPRRFADINQSENVIGNVLLSCKNAFHCFECENLENGKWCLWIANADSSDCYDYTFFGLSAHRMYEAVGSWNHSSDIVFCARVTNESVRLYYCESCNATKDCFACVGLRNKQYCILNKQYTKEEYEALVPKIIDHMRSTGEWGEFFPSRLGLFGYNESVGNDYFPLSKEEALNLWFNWSDYEAPFPKVEKIIPANKLPENIADIPDDILNWAIECEITKKPFRIIKQELEFYRKHSLPVPRRHPDQRHLDRLALRNPRKLYERKCDNCGKDIITTYSPDRPETVYCEECYNREVYG